MSFTAGQKLRASDLNKIQPVLYTAIQTGNGGGVQTITTTEADCLGATVTFTSLTAAVCEITAFWDIDVTTGGVTVCQGRIAVDGVTLSQEAHFSAITTASRCTAGRTWKFTLGGSGSHTVKMRVLKTAAAGAILCDDNHTVFTLAVQEVL
jgi:hypothetical protein